MKEIGRSLKETKEELTSGPNSIGTLLSLSVREPTNPFMEFLKGIHYL